MPFCTFLTHTINYIAERHTYTKLEHEGSSHETKEQRIAAWLKEICMYRYYLVSLEKKKKTKQIYEEDMISISFRFVLSIIFVSLTFQ